MDNRPCHRRADQWRFPVGYLLQQRRRLPRNRYLHQVDRLHGTDFGSSRGSVEPQTIVGQSLIMNHKSFHTALQSWVDSLGAGVSITCAIQCVLFPLLIGVLPLIGLGFLAQDGVETGFLAASIVLALGSFSWGFRQHRRRYIFLFLIGGLALIFHRPRLGGRRLGNFFCGAGHASARRRPSLESAIVSPLRCVRGKQRYRGLGCRSGS